MCYLVGPQAIVRLSFWAKKNIWCN
jgi:hypothetical protein